MRATATLTVQHTEHPDYAFVSYVWASNTPAGTPVRLEYHTEEDTVAEHIATTSAEFDLTVVDRR